MCWNISHDSHWLPLPFAKRMRELVQKEIGDGVRILDYTHDAGT